MSAAASLSGTIVDVRPPPVRGRPAGHGPHLPPPVPPLPPARRAEALADARAAAWHAWHGLLRRGLDPVAIGVTGIAAQRRPLRPQRPPARHRRPAAGGPWTSWTLRYSRRPGSRSSASTGTPSGSRGRARTPGGTGWPRTTGSGRPTRRLPGRLRGVARRLPATEAPGRRTAGRGPRRGRRGRGGRADARAGQPDPDRTEGELGGVPGRGDRRPDRAAGSGRRPAPAACG